MIKIINSYSCCGCAACVQVCPKQCISFQENEEGFCYPLVNEVQCINCGLCEKVCPVLNIPSSKGNPLKVLACKNKDTEVREESSSGGIFTLLAEQVLEAGGVVFGAEFDKNWEVRHNYIEHLSDLSRLRRSKYVQSRIEDNYKKVRSFLQEGRKVLFVGTSCQIAGLRNYLRCDYENLLLVDVICHGTPSPKVWRAYLEKLKARQGFAGKNSVFLSLKNRPVITGVNFRDKCSGWQKYSFSVYFAGALAEGEKNTVFQSTILSKDTYMRSFLSNLNLRPSCYRCPAKGGRSHADITLADYWGIWNQYPEFNDDRGVGLVIVHSHKGLSSLSFDKMDTIEVSLEDATANNPSYWKSVKEPVKRYLFFSRFNNGEDLDVIVDDLLRVPYILKVLKGIKSVLAKVVKGKLKKIVRMYLMKNKDNLKI